MSRNESHDLFPSGEKKENCREHENAGKGKCKDRVRSSFVAKVFPKQKKRKERKKEKQTRKQESIVHLEQYKKRWQNELISKRIQIIFNEQVKI